MYKLFLDPFWNFSTWEQFIPEGYTLVEKPEHKKKRLEERLKSLEKQVEYHSKEGARVADELEEIKKELKT